MRLYQIILTGIGILILYAALAFGFYTNVATQTPGANDFYSRWMGTRLLFTRGLDPYSAEATREIQMGMYGRLARPDEDQVAFAYPLYAAFLAAPFVPFDYAVAESLWIAFLVLAVCAAGVITARLFELRLTPFVLAGLLLFVLAFYPTLRGLFLGQYTLLLFASFAFTLFLIARGYDGWAGVVLSFSMVKPHIAVLMVACLLVWCAWHKRWRVVGAFALALGAMSIAAMLFVPNWIFEFIGAVTAYQKYISIGPPLQVLCETFLPASVAGMTAWLGTLLLLVMLIYRTARTIRADLIGFIPTLELAMLITTLAMVRTATTDQTLLLIAWIHWFAVLQRARRGWWAVLAASVVVILPWAVFLTTLSGNLEAPIATTTAVILTTLAYVAFYARTWLPARGAMVKEQRVG